MRASGRSSAGGGAEGSVPLEARDEGAFGALAVLALSSAVMGVFVGVFLPASLRGPGAAAGAALALGVAAVTGHQPAESAVARVMGRPPPLRGSRPTVGPSWKSVYGRRPPSWPLCGPSSRPNLAAARRPTASRALFIANMSHEIRTPLNSVLALSQLLRDGMAGPLQRSAALPGGHRAQRTEPAPPDQRHPRPVADRGRPPGDGSAGPDIGAQIRATSARWCRWPGEGLDLHARAAGRPPTVRCDVDRVRQILTNLIGNAIKFTETGQVQVSAEARGEMVAVHVTDTGVGIPDSAKTKCSRSSSRSTVHGAAPGRHRPRAGHRQPLRAPDGRRDHLRQRGRLGLALFTLTFRGPLPRRSRQLPRRAPPTPAAPSCRGEQDQTARRPPCCSSSEPTGRSVHAPSRCWRGFRSRIDTARAAAGDGPVLSSCGPSGHA